jgi:hypothetical protein
LLLAMTASDWSLMPYLPLQSWAVVFVGR